MDPSLDRMETVIGDGQAATIGSEDTHAQVIFDPWETYLMSTDAPVNSDRVCHQWRGAGEDFPLPYLPAHSGSP